jgi:uncharacterized protein (TIGR02646 family)
MRQVARSPLNHVDAALNSKRSNGLTETEWAIWWYGNQPPSRVPLPPKPTKPPTFTAYKAAAVRTALETMFENKCAYCESWYAHLMPTDIEHYRPKGAWRDESGNLVKPGYYWLAADWNNLLASCADCNRERNQTRRTAGGKIVKVKSGKANSFPLAPSSPRWTSPTPVLNEQPLLLDPCNDGPDDHLHFSFDGFVAAKDSAQEAMLPKGQTTIDVCGLARDLLVTYRRDKLEPFIDAVCRVCACEYNVARMPGDQVSLDQLTEAKAALQNALRSSQEYLAARNTLMNLFERLRPKVSAYRAALTDWEQSPQDPNRIAALRATVTGIKAVADSDPLNRPFVDKLLPNWGISQLR